MTRDEIIRLARESGFSETEALFRTLYISAPSDLERFAALVAAAAREAAHITVSELQQGLVAVGLVCPDAIDSADGYDSGATLARIYALHTAIRARVKE
jgi:hypothetical protein